MHIRTSICLMSALVCSVAAEAPAAPIATIGSNGGDLPPTTLLESNGFANIRKAVFGAQGISMQVNFLLGTQGARLTGLNINGASICTLLDSDPGGTQASASCASQPNVTTWVLRVD